METKNYHLIKDDNCGCCYNQIDYFTCYCCTLCWNLICPNCVKVFEEDKLYYDGAPYTVCNSNCFIVHNILNNMFNTYISLHIASFQPCSIRK